MRSDVRSTLGYAAGWTVLRAQAFRVRHTVLPVKPGAAKPTGGRQARLLAMPRLGPERLQGVMLRWCGNLTFSGVSIVRVGRSPWWWSLTSPWSEGRPLALYVSSWKVLPSLGQKSRIVQSCPPSVLTTAGAPRQRGTGRSARKQRTSRKETRRDPWGVGNG